MRKSPARRREAGFTLLEVVLALSIFGLIAAILYGAFSLSHNAVNKAQASFDKNQRLRSAGDMLGSYIRSSYPYRASPQDQTVYYLGEEDSVTFVSSFSLTLGGRGMAKIRVYRDGEDSRQASLRLEEMVPFRIDEEGGGQRTSVVLEEGISAFRLAYLDSQSQDENWEDRWDGQERHALPRAVRISYRASDGKPVLWIVPLMMNVLAQ
jgi:general secretion pathway protein J